MPYAYITNIIIKLWPINGFASIDFEHICSAISRTVEFLLAIQFPCTAWLYWLAGWWLHATLPRSISGRHVHVYIHAASQLQRTDIKRANKRNANCEVTQLDEKRLSDK